MKLDIFRYNVKARKKGTLNFDICLQTPDGTNAHHFSVYAPSNTIAIITSAETAELYEADQVAAAEQLRDFFNRIWFYHRKTILAATTKSAYIQVLPI